MSNCKLDSNRKFNTQVSAFANPETNQPVVSNQSISDNVMDSLKQTQEQNNLLLNVTQGILTKPAEGFLNYNEENDFDGNYKSIYSQFITGEQVGESYRRAFMTANNLNGNETGYGRTINVPKVLPPGQIPPPSFNGAHTIGEKCVGKHCSVPVEPTLAGMSRNLLSANPPAQAMSMYPGTYRPGNSSDKLPTIVYYNHGTATNHGPYNIEVMQDELSNYAKW